MRLAVMSNRPDDSGIVPDTFEKSPYLLFVETDTRRIEAAFSGESPEQYALRIAASGAEAVVCGRHIGKACFDPIADACVSRYDGTELPVMEAALAALDNRLPLIPEYEGGPGCGSGRGDCGAHCH